METRQRAPADTIPLGLAFDTAVRRHQEERLREADSPYRKILQSRPEHPCFWHRLGLMAQRRGNLTEAVKLIQKALALKPDFAEALFDTAPYVRNLENAYRQMWNRFLAGKAPEQINVIEGKKNPDVNRNTREQQTEEGTVPDNENHSGWPHEKKWTY